MSTKSPPKKAKIVIKEVESDMSDDSEPDDDLEVERMISGDSDSPKEIKTPVKTPAKKASTPANVRCEYIMTKGTNVGKPCAASCNAKKEYQDTKRCSKHFGKAGLVVEETQVEGETKPIAKKDPTPAPEVVKDEKKEPEPIKEKPAEVKVEHETLPDEVIPPGAEIIDLPIYESGGKITKVSPVTSDEKTPEGEPGDEEEEPEEELSKEDMQKLSLIKSRYREFPWLQSMLPFEEINNAESMSEFLSQIQTALNNKGIDDMLWFALRDGIGKGLVEGVIAPAASLNLEGYAREVIEADEHKIRDILKIIRIQNQETLGGVLSNPYVQLGVSLGMGAVGLHLRNSAKVGVTIGPGPTPSIPPATGTFVPPLPVATSSPAVEKKNRNPPGSKVYDE